MSSNSFTSFYNEYPSEKNLKKLLKVAETLKENSFLYVFDLQTADIFYSKNIHLLGLDYMNLQIFEIFEAYHPKEKPQLELWMKKALEFAKIKYYPPFEYGIIVTQRYVHTNGETLLVKRTSSVIYDNGCPRYQFSICEKLPNNTNIHTPTIQLMYPEDAPKSDIKEAYRFYNLIHQSQNSKIDRTIFTLRRLEILRLKEKNMTSQEIADLIHIDVETVNWHLKQLRNKLNLRRTDLVIQYAKEKNLLKVI